MNIKIKKKINNLKRNKQELVTIKIGSSKKNNKIIKKDLLKMF